MLEKLQLHVKPEDRNKKNVQMNKFNCLCQPLFILSSAQVSVSECFFHLEHVASRLFCHRILHWVQTRITGGKLKISQVQVERGFFCLFFVFYKGEDKRLFCSQEVDKTEDDN